MNRMRHAATLIIMALVGLAGWLGAAPSAAAPAWDLPPRLVDEPAGIAALRAQYASLTEGQLVAAGFQVDALYVTAPAVGLPPSAGAMGYHAINQVLMGAQFPVGTMDPQRPPVVLLGPDKRVIGVEWEAADRGQPAPQLYGQTANLGPAHPGVDAPHYMLHAYFRPGGKVLFGDFDPALSTPGLPSTGAGGARRAWLADRSLVTLLLAASGVLALLAIRRRGIIGERALR